MGKLFLEDKSASGENIGVTLALIPAFSPGEKEKRLPRLEKNQAAGLAGLMYELSKNVSGKNPLLGGGHR